MPGRLVASATMFRTYHTCECPLQRCVLQRARVVPTAGDASAGLGRQGKHRSISSGQRHALFTWASRRGVPLECVAVPRR
jgi:hypothetical protein